MLHILFSLLCLKYIFFWFYRSVRFEAKERVRTCKDYVIVTVVISLPITQIHQKYLQNCK